MATVFLGLGANLGDRGKNIQAALADLERWGIKIVRASCIYETEPVGPVKDQGWFLNMAVKAETSLPPEEVLKVIQAIELSLKRQKTIKEGPRTIDIDILFYDSLVADVPGLQIPHSRIPERKFVLVPLEEIAADFVHPVLKKSVAELLNECEDAAIVRPL